MNTKYTSFSSLFAIGIYRLLVSLIELSFIKELSPVSDSRLACQRPWLLIHALPKHTSLFNNVSYFRIYFWAVTHRLLYHHHWRLTLETTDLCLGGSLIWVHLCIRSRCIVLLKFHLCWLEIHSTIRLPHECIDRVSKLGILTLLFFMYFQLLFFTPICLYYFLLNFHLEIIDRRLYRFDWLLLISVLFYWESCWSFWRWVSEFFAFLRAFLSRNWCFCNLLRPCCQLVLCQFTQRGSTLLLCNAWWKDILARQRGNREALPSELSSFSAHARFISLDVLFNFSLLALLFELLCYDLCCWRSSYLFKFYWLQPTLRSR